MPHYRPARLGSACVDLIFSPPLLPRMLTKPRTVCARHLVAAMISGNVAPLLRFIIAMTSAFLLGRSALGLLAAFLALPALGLRSLGLRLAGLILGCDSAGAHLSLLDRVAVVTIHHSSREKLRPESLAIRQEERAIHRGSNQLAGTVPFL